MITKPVIIIFGYFEYDDLAYFENIQEILEIFCNFSNESTE